jgi:hypothetical protein
MWCLTVREEYKLEVFENKVLRNTFWPKEDEVSGRYSILQNEELCDLYLSSCIVTEVKLGGL